MNLIKPSFVIEGINGEDLLLMERAGRTCYKSEPKGDSEGFLRSKIKAGHLTIIEHMQHTFKIPRDGKGRPIMLQACIDEILEHTTGTNISLTDNYYYISMNPRTLREAVEKAYNPLLIACLNTVRDKFPCLYDDLEIRSHQYLTLLSFKEKMELPPDIGAKHNIMTVRFIADRGFTHELVRHRIAVYSQESTRYCDYGGGVTFIIPPWVNAKEGTCLQYVAFPDEATNGWLNVMWNTEQMYIDLLAKGWHPQQARSVLPNSLKTEIVMTATLKEWQLVFRQRALGQTGRPHPQMLELMVPLLAEARRILPKYFSEDVLR